MFKYLLAASMPLTMLLCACSTSAGVAPSQKSVKNKQCDGFIQLSEKQAAHILIFPVKTGKLATPMEFSSVVEAPPDSTGIICPQLSGLVTKVLVDVGDTVKTGQPLIYISSPELADAQSNYFHARAKLEEVRAEANLINTKIMLAAKDVSRLEGLVKDGISARRDLENAQVKAATASADLVASIAAAQAAQSQLAAAEVRLRALGVKAPSLNPQFSADLPLKSPVSGTVIRRNVSPGLSVSPAIAAASPGGRADLIAVADLSKVWVMLEVPQNQIARLKIGTPIEFRTEVAPGKVFVGKVTKLGETFDINSHCTQVRTEITNRSNFLKPGMLVIATVNGATGSPGSALVPASALQEIDGKSYVFLDCGKNLFKKQIVKLLSSTESLCQITGLAAGVRIATEGSFLLKSEAIKRSMGGEE